MISFDFITERLATGGGINSYDDVDQLVTSGITHSVDCTWTEADQSFMASNPAISVLWNPTEDNGEHKEPAWFAESIDFAFMALSKPDAKLYCHCDQGRNRGPSTAFCIMLAMGWEYNVAIDLIHNQRPETKGCIIYANDAANAVKELGYG